MRPVLYAYRRRDGARRSYPMRLRRDVYWQGSNMHPAYVPAYRCAELCNPRGVLDRPFFLEVIWSALYEGGCTKFSTGGVRFRVVGKHMEHQ